MVEQHQIEREGFLDDALVVLARRKRPIGLSEKDAVPWFGRIEGWVVDDHWERERFGSKERKVAEQSRDIRAEREDTNAVGCLLNGDSDGR